jgi:Tfp pilus assembly protein PilX
MKIRHHQTGSVLIISLVMLVLLTLIAVSAIQTTTGMVQIVGNAQFREEGIGAAQQGIDQLITSVTATNGIRTQAETMNATGTTVDINGDGQADYTVSFSPVPACLSRSNAGTYVDNQIHVEQGIARANTPQDTPAKAAAFAAARANLKLLGTCKASTSGLSTQCYWSLWRVTAAVTDPFTGVNAVVTQGVRVLIGLNNKVNNCD